jgi:hypothetical protein
MDIYGWILFALLLLSGGFNLDQYLRRRDIEIDLKLYHGDLLVARDRAENLARVHYQAAADAIKSLIRNHFKE